MTEESIVHRAREGEEDAYRQLFDQNYSRVFRIAIAYTSCTFDDARDIAQKTFITAFNKLDTLNDASKFSQWVGTIARNTAMQHLRDNKGRPEVKLLPQMAADEYLMIEDEGNCEEEEKQLSIIREIIKTIPSDSIKRTVEMYYMDGKKTEEIARELNVPKSTVTSRLDRFRAKCRKIILRRILVFRGEQDS